MASLSLLSACSAAQVTCLELFFFSYCAIMWVLEWKFTLVLGQSKKFITTRRGRSYVLSWQCSSQPFWADSRAANTPQLPRSAFCHINVFNGISGQFNRWTRTGARRGWGEKSVVGVGREVSERSWSLQLLAESGSEIILCRSCIYYLDFCNSFPPKPACQ